MALHLDEFHFPIIKAAWKFLKSDFMEVKWTPFFFLSLKSDHLLRIRFTGELPNRKVLKRKGTQRRVGL